MKRKLDNTDVPVCKKQRLESMRSNILHHDIDIAQYQTILGNIQKSKLILLSSISTIITQQIAEFACGEIRKCDNINCKFPDTEISLLLSEISDPTLYRKNNLLFDDNANGFFEDDNSMFIYCNDCKNTGRRCNRCNRFGFTSKSCYRCRISICDFCGDGCDNPKCKINYCIGGDVNSFTSGCGERFLSEIIECSICEIEHVFCHGCEDKYDEECHFCKKAKRKKNKRKNKKTINNMIYNIGEMTKGCKQCQSNPDEDKGRICDGCDMFICGDHCNKYGRFCRGICDKFCCNDCVKRGELNDCNRDECQEMVCKKCEYKCENCWDFLMMHGVDDEDIEKALRDGNYSDYFDD